MLHFLDLFQQVLPVSPDKFGEFLEVERLFEAWQWLQSDWYVCTVLLSAAFVCWLSRSLNLAWWVVVSECLHPLLIVDPLILSDVNEVEQFLDDGVLWQILV